MSTIATSAWLEALLHDQPPSPAAGDAALAWLKPLRAQALERVNALTLPTVREEAWRFTDISPLTRQTLHPLRTPTPLREADIAPFHIPEAGTRLVFVDGVHAPALSCTAPDFAATASTLQTAPPSLAAGLAPHLTRHATFHNALFTALNTAFLQDAALLTVPRNTALASPVHLLFIATQPAVASHPRLLLVAEPGSAVIVVEDYVSLHAGPGFTNAVAEIVVGANAKLEHIRLQRESHQAIHLGRCDVSLAPSARYHAVSIALGAHISRQELAVQQTGEGTECTLDGLALLSGQQLADTHTFIDHARPQGRSRQLHKTIVDGTAHAVFNGKVRVAPGAQGTDSAQTSRNLLLTPQAVVDTQPQLEIFADDVKCTHGAAVGQLDSEEIFYLQSRGLSRDAARKLLTYAFAADVIDRIPVASLRQQLETAVLEQTHHQP
jgi:Fe-S cluster assembly protein SufD